MRTQAPLHHVREAHPAWFIAPFVTATIALAAAVLFFDREPATQAALATTPDTIEPAPAAAATPQEDRTPTPEVPHVQAF